MLPLPKEPKPFPLEEERVFELPFLLDTTIAHMIQRICKEQGTTVIISSHNLNFVADISSRILLLEKGKLVKDLPNADGAAIAELNEYFGIQAE